MRRERGGRRVQSMRLRQCGDEQYNCKGDSNESGQAGKSSQALRSPRTGDSTALRAPVHVDHAISCPAVSANPWRRYTAMSAARGTSENAVPLSASRPRNGAAQGSNLPSVGLRRLLVLKTSWGTSPCRSGGELYSGLCQQTTQPSRAPARARRPVRRPARGRRGERARMRPRGRLLRRSHRR